MQSQIEYSCSEIPSCLESQLRFGSTIPRFPRGSATRGINIQREILIVICSWGLKFSTHYTVTEKYNKILTDHQQGRLPDNTRWKRPHCVNSSFYPSHDDNSCQCNSQIQNNVIHPARSVLIQGHICCPDCDPSVYQQTDQSVILNVATTQCWYFKDGEQLNVNVSVNQETECCKVHESVARKFKLQCQEMTGETKMSLAVAGRRKQTEQIAPHQQLKKDIGPLHTYSALIEHSCFYYRVRSQSQLSVNMHETYCFLIV